MTFYTYKDLERWSELDFAPPARVAVFGDPIKHSLSPQMHNPGLKLAGVDAQYVRLHIAPGELGDALAALKVNEFYGTNVTIPHKAAIAGEMDELTESAEKIGAVNTVKIVGDRLIGHNTDGPGFERALEEEFGVSLSDQRVLLLGAGGGAGRAVAVQCALSRCAHLTLANRTITKANTLSEELSAYYPPSLLSVCEMTPEILGERLNEIDLIVNATSIGMKENDPALISVEDFTPHHLVYDMVYAPPVTQLMRDAESAGARSANGLSMLLWQGAIAFEFWFQHDAPIEAMRSGLYGAVA